MIKNEMYKQMQEVVNRYVEHYKEDFYFYDVLSLHDSDNWVLQHPEDVESFVWFVRDAGTGLVSLTADSKQVGFDVINYYLQHERILRAYILTCKYDAEEGSRQWSMEEATLEQITQIAKGATE